MKRFIILGGMAILVSLGVAHHAPSREIVFDRPVGHVVVPPSSVVLPTDNIFGRVHTNLLVFVPDDGKRYSVSPPLSANTPASIACVYNLVPQVDGCPISGTTQNPTGGANAIGIVDAYDDPKIESDLGVFDTQFGLPSCTTDNGCFTKVYGGEKQPANANQFGWDIEISLDVEWAHAMAPNAKIILVEAENNYGTALLTAEIKAAKMVKAAGGGEVSNSWGGNESSGQLVVDSTFNAGGVVYFASTGDNGSGVIYPSTSPNVVAVGGTTLNRVAGNFTSETGWSGSGGGPSMFEHRPAFQDSIQRLVGGHRGVPDISLVADPSTGAAVYDTDNPVYQWTQIGGTSLSSPAVAGIINAAGVFNGESGAALKAFYNDYSNSRYGDTWRDIVSGSNGGYDCTRKWDFVTGIGSPIGYDAK